MYRIAMHAAALKDSGAHQLLSHFLLRHKSLQLLVRSPAGGLVLRQLLTFDGKGVRPLLRRPKGPQLISLQYIPDMSRSASASAAVARLAGAGDRIDNSIISSEPCLPLAMSVARRAGASDIPDDGAYGAPAGGTLSQALPEGTPGDPSTLMRPAAPTHSGQPDAGTDRPDRRSAGSPETQQALIPAQPGPTASATPAAAPPEVPASPAVSRRFIGAQRLANSAERRRGKPAPGTVDSGGYSGPTGVATAAGAPRGSKRTLAAATAAPSTATPLAPQPTEQLMPHSGPSFKAEQKAFKRPGLSTLARNAAKFVAQTERDNGASDGHIAGGAEITRSPSIEAHIGSLAVAAPAAPPPADGTPAWAGSSRSSPVSTPPAVSLLATPAEKTPQQPAISAVALEIMSRLIPSAEGPQADQLAVAPQPHPCQGCVFEPAAICAVHFKMGI